MFCVREVCWFARMHLLQLQDCQHSSDISLFTLHLTKTKKNTSRNSAQTIAKSSILYPECMNHKIWNQSLCIFCETFHISQKTEVSHKFGRHFSTFKFVSKGGMSENRKGGVLRPPPLLGLIGLRKNWTCVFKLGP